ncbi:MAG: tetratricopeptide repeat protein [Candidatus Omnitrophica bacterium]|nr:tetratricopeptide repeat protein [Candidatus Omnitrophota bacterium]
MRLSQYIKKPLQDYLPKDRRIFSFFLLIFWPLFFTSCVHSDNSFYFGHYSEAESLFNHGVYEKAIQKYQAYIDENPEGHLAIISQYYIARSYAALGHQEEAKGLYQQIIQKYPDAVWARFSETQLKDLQTSSDLTARPSPSEISVFKT